MRTPDLSILGRMAIGFGIVLLLICGEALVLRNRNVRVDNLEARQHQLILPAYMNVRDLRTDLLRRAMALRGYALTGSGNFRDQAEALELKASAVEAQLSHLDANADPGLLSQIARNLQAYTAASHRFAGLVESKALGDQIPEGERRLDAIRINLMQDLKALDNVETARLDATDAAIEHARTEARSSLMLCWLLVAAATGITGLLTAHSVRHQALALLQATRALSRGEFEPAVALATTGEPRTYANELRELADAFGRTAVSLRDRERNVRTLATELREKNELLMDQNQTLQDKTGEIQTQNEELRKREELLQRQNTELTRQKEELAVLHKEKDQFLAIASHELRTPITTLKLQAYQLIRRSAEHPEWQSVVPAIRAIDAHATRLNELITRMLDASRANGGSIEVQRREVDLSEIVRLCSAQAQARTARHPVIVSGAETRLAGDWDGGYLEQMLTNLLENAIRYSPMGGDIAVRVDRSDGEAVVSVTDHGIGIPEEAQRKLFRPYFRHQGARNVTPEGMGLGLYVTHGIVQAHGGSIRVRSQPAVGTTFTVTLPRRATPVAASSPPS